MDVQRDGNCFFRAVSVCVYGDQTHHISLRTSVARHIQVMDRPIFIRAGITDVDVSLKKSAHAVEADGTSVSQDAILATADYLQRDVNIYVASSQFSPVAHPPVTCKVTLPPINMAFYMAVSCMTQHTTGTASNEVNKAAVDSPFSSCVVPPSASQLHSMTTKHSGNQDSPPNSL